MTVRTKPAARHGRREPEENGLRRKETPMDRKTYIDSVLSALRHVTGDERQAIRAELEGEDIRFTAELKE